GGLTQIYIFEDEIPFECRICGKYFRSSLKHSKYGHSTYHLGNNSESSPSRRCLICRPMFSLQ
ncbi:unnamed protein product, partial [Hymenolepis diminuta]